MPQFERRFQIHCARIKPKLLAPGGLRTPAVRLLFLIFIERTVSKAPRCKYSATTSAGVNACPRQGGVELVDDLPTRRADLRAGFGRRMRGDDDPCARSCRGQLQIRKVKEGSGRFLFQDASSAGQVAGPSGLAPFAD